MQLQSSYSGRPIFRTRSGGRLHGMGDLPTFLDPFSNSPPPDTSGSTGTGTGSGSSIDWNTLFSTAAQAATSIYQATTAADIAKAQAQAQAANPLYVRPTGSTSPIFSTGNLFGTGSNLTPVLLLAGLGLAAYFIMK